MNRQFEDQLSAAFDDLADEAHPPADLWNRTDRRILQRQVRTRAAIAAGGLAVVAVVAIAALRTFSSSEQRVRVVTHPDQRTQTSRLSNASTTAPASTTAAPAVTSSPAPVVRTPDSWDNAPTAGSSLAKFEEGGGSFAVWGGNRLFVGETGCCDSIGGPQLGVYAPATKRWTSTTLPMGARMEATAVWTGSELVVTGGYKSPDGTQTHESPAAETAAYNPATGTWRTLAAAPRPFAHTQSVWTGEEIFVYPAGLAYSPSKNTWRELPPSVASVRSDAAIAWTGTELVVWGGNTGTTGNSVVHSDGLAYNPSRNAWRPIPSAPVPARQGATAVWTGKEVVVWGGDDGTAGPSTNYLPNNYYGQGAAYNPLTDTWRKIASSPLKSRSGHDAVWSGTEMFILGGTHPAPDGTGRYLDSVAAYNPATDAWRSIPLPAAVPTDTASTTWVPTARAGAVAVWTGTQVMLVGGYDEFHQNGTYTDVALTPGH